MSPESTASKIGKSVGEKIRAARTAQHYTQSQLAAPDFSVSYISAIERGQIHPSLRAMEILATRLGLSSTQLLATNKDQQDEPRPAPLTIPERDDDEWELALLGVEALIRQGMATQAVAQLTKISTRRLKSQLQIKYRYLLGWAYLETAQLQACEFVLSEAVQLAKEANNHYLHTRILNLLGIAYATMGNYAQALSVHQRCRDLLEEVTPRDLFFITQVYTHLGEHFAELEHFDESLHMFHTALALTADLGSVQKRQVSYSEHTQYYAATRDFTVASLYAHKSLFLSHQEVRNRLNRELHYYLGHALLGGDQEQVHKSLEELLTQANVTEDQLIVASIFTRLAEWQLVQQNLREAEQYAQQAYDELTRSFDDTVIAADALIMLGRIKYAQERLQEGDTCFIAGLAILERLDNQEELAEQSARYAQLLEEHGKTQEAFTYFRRAYQYSQ